jgi:hypothetical protein
MFCCVREEGNVRLEGMPVPLMYVVIHDHPNLYIYEFRGSKSRTEKSPKRSVLCLYITLKCSLTFLTDAVYR